MNKFKERSYTAPLDKQRNQIGKYKEKLDYKFFLNKSNNKANVPQSGTNTIVTNNPLTKKKLTGGSLVLLSFIAIIGILFLFMIISLLFFRTKVQEI